MKSTSVAKTVVAAGLFSTGALAQSACSAVLVPTYTPPAVAPGWQAQLVTGGLKKPRSIEFDSTGALLVVDSGKGVLRYTFTDNGATCLQVLESRLLINQTSVSSRGSQGSPASMDSAASDILGLAVKPRSCPLGRRHDPVRLVG